MNYGAPARRQGVVDPDRWFCAARCSSGGGTWVMHNDIVAEQQNTPCSPSPKKKQARADTNIGRQRELTLVRPPRPLTRRSRT